MNFLFENILATRRNGPNSGALVQILIIVIVFASYAIKLFAKAKDSMADNDEPKKPIDRRQNERRQSTAATNAYKTLEQLRDERATQIHRDETQRPAARPHQEPTPPHRQPARQEPVFKPQPIAPAVSSRSPEVEYDFGISTPARPTRSVAANAASPKQYRKNDRPAQPSRKSVFAAPSSITAEPAEQNQIFNTEIGLGSIEEIRKAIIYAEILGKPIALR